MQKLNTITWASGAKLHIHYLIFTAELFQALQMSIVPTRHNHDPINSSEKLNLLEGNTIFP